MSKRRTDSDGNRLDGKPGHGAVIAHAANGDVDSEPNIFHELLSAPEALTRVMAFFCDHGSGYLKVRRSDPGGDLHLTWTYSGGKYAGTYLYVRVEYWRLLFGLELLERKVLEADGGVRKPTPDRYGAGR
jgi:hypothetical protein